MDPSRIVTRYVVSGRKEINLRLRGLKERTNSSFRKFWHQCLQLNVKGPAEYATHTLLHIPKGTLVARYTKIFFAFYVSGTMHLIADSGGAVTISESGALRCFCTQALGIMIEDAVQELYRRSGGDQKSCLPKAVGYIWVVLFLSWSSPVWVYPVARTMKRDDMMLSIYALGPLVSYFF